SEQGRQSVEVVVTAAALALLVLSGFSPVEVNSLTTQQQENRASVIVTLLVNFAFVLIAAFKGKLRMALVGTLVPFVALTGAIRLARPGSPWAKRFYRERHKKRARSTLRAYHHDKRWVGPRRRFQDLIGGAPTPDPARTPR
ncbi:hypothetical protein GT042_15260, partial [Streptomyces sp. SID3212]|nr:hypothetical protein [Streptomyces sp. SID3212]